MEDLKENNDKNDFLTIKEKEKKFNKFRLIVHLICSLLVVVLLSSNTLFISDTHYYESEVIMFSIEIYIISMALSVFIMYNFLKLKTKSYVLISNIMVVLITFGSLNFLINKFDTTELNSKELNYFKDNLMLISNIKKELLTIPDVKKEKLLLKIEKIENDYSKINMPLIKRQYYILDKEKEDIKKEYNLLQEKENKDKLEKEIKNVITNKNK